MQKNLHFRSEHHCNNSLKQLMAKKIVYIDKTNMETLKMTKLKN
jgi:hypothetical protein